MPLLDDDALVLDTHPFRERHLVLAVLTRSHGVLRGVFRGARGGRTPQAASTQVLSLVTVSAWLAPRAELATFREVALVRSSFPLAESVERATAAAVVAELLATFCPPQEPAALFFRLGVALLDALLGGVDPETGVAYATLWTLALGGVLPPLDRCSACGAELEEEPSLRPDTGHPLCPRCAPPGADRLDAAALERMAVFRHSPVAQLRPGVPPSLTRWLDRVVRREAERPLHALDFFRQNCGR